MKIERIVHHPVGPAEVYAMSITPAYQEKKCEDAGAMHWEVDVQLRDDDTSVVKAKRKLPTAGFPSMLRKVVPSGVTSTEIIHWGHAEPDGSRVGKLHVDFHGAPARMNGEIRISVEADNGSTITVDADFSVMVPLVGKKLELLSSRIILDVIDAEERTAKQWVAGTG